MTLYKDEEAMNAYPTSTWDLELIPGTELMREEDSAFPHQKVLVPRPSSDPADPLTWSRKWKLSLAVIQVLYTVLIAATALSIPPMFPLLAAEFDLSEIQLSLLVGATVIVLGYANIIMIPCSNIFGRRAVCLASGVIICATCIWEALAKSYGSLIAARCVNGFATATSETIMVQVIADVFFLHERGTWMGIYFISMFGGVLIGPVIAGNICEKYGWRSYFWLSFGLGAASFLLILFGYPETKYRRSAQDFAGAAQRLSNATTLQETEKTSGTPPTKEISSESFSQQLPSPSPKSSPNPCSNPDNGHGHPSRQNYLLYPPPDPRWKSLLLRDVLTPLRLSIYPIVLFAALNVAGAANTLIFWNLTESAVLSAGPYFFSPSAVGYSNFAVLVGCFIGAATAGPFSDWVAARATRRNGGVREAEMRLPALIPFALVTAAAIVCGGVGYQDRWSWPLVLVFGYGLTGICVASVPGICIAYAVDCYKPVSGEIMVVATVFKNSIGFGMSWWIFPMAAKVGWVNTAMVDFGLTMGPLLLAIPVYIWGKKLRRRTKDSGVHEWEAQI
ncbi:MFS general substrate transporter [Aulographum hederae CBS 113979]|uniref:MFS general substrate transporter n=1 Tax=Aulographum hederae CBS 113979 TaxID=1176131 RepID=A0A6G1H9H0_9PEZI|nr:MFS general substrate transporter [Aulographum hederae CBS 113979]